MAKIKVSVNEEAFDSGGIAESPKPGVYSFRIRELNNDYSKGDDGKPDKSRPRTEVVLECIDPKAKDKGVDGGSAFGARVWDYITYGEGGQWKLAMFLRALGIADKSKAKSGKVSATLDTDKFAEFSSDPGKSQKKTGNSGAVVKCRITADTDRDGNYRPRVGAYLPIADEDEDAEGDAFDESEESTASDEEWEDEEEEEEDEEEADEEEGYTEDRLKAMEPDEIKEIASGLGIKFKGMKKSQVITAILEAQESSDAEDNEEEEDTPF